MRQYDIVEIVAKRLNNEKLCSGIFLGGSLATNQEDEYSDINFHVVLSNEQRDNFLSKIGNILELYRTIIYFKIIRADRIKYIFDDGICFDLFIHLNNDFLLPSNYCIIFDDLNIINNLTKESGVYSNKEIGELINQYSLLSIEFSKSYFRKDIVYSMSILNEMSVAIGKFLRSLDDLNNSKDGLKRGFETLSNVHKVEYSNIIKDLKYNSMLSCMQKMSLLISEEVKRLPIEIGQFINYDLYDCSKRVVFGLER